MFQVIEADVMVWWFAGTGGARRGAFPLEPMEYVFTEGTAANYDVMYDTVHAVPATPVSAVQSEASNVTLFPGQRKLVRTSDGTLYVAYFKNLAGNSQIYVIKSEDDGVTWTDDTLISTTLGMDLYHQGRAAIAVDSQDYLHVVWHGRSAGYPTRDVIWYALYDGSWHTPIKIGGVSYHHTNSAIAVDSNDYLHVVWQGQIPAYPNGAIWYVKYDGSWSAPLRISTYANMAVNPHRNASIAVDSNDYLHVVWEGRATGFTTFYQIWHNKYTTSWVGPVRISTAANMSSYAQSNPSIAVDSQDHLHVVWVGLATGFTTIYQVWYATAVPPHAAGDWVTPIRISDALNMATSHQFFAVIAVDSNDYLHVLWHGKATGYTTQDVVWYAVYVASWATPVCIQPTGRNMYPILRWSRWPR